MPLCDKIYFSYMIICIILYDIIYSSYVILYMLRPIRHPSLSASREFCMNMRDASRFLHNYSPSTPRECPCNAQKIFRRRIRGLWAFCVTPCCPVAYVLPRACDGFPVLRKSLSGMPEEPIRRHGGGFPARWERPFRASAEHFVLPVGGVWRGEREVYPRRCVPDGCAEGASPVFRRSVSRIRNVKIFYFRECIIIHKRVFLSCIPEVFRVRACRRLRAVKGGEVCKQL